MRSWLRILVAHAVHVVPLSLPKVTKPSVDIQLHPHFSTGKHSIIMALALSKAAPLQPEIKLAQALVEYENILSDEERSQLRAEGVPDATAAINLTTRIDRDCNDRRSRCMGPRLITVLESIQQFSTTVDTIISSHPEYAALVWGGVKLALLVMLILSIGYRD